MTTITITNNTEFSPELAVQFARAEDIKFDYGCCLYHGGEDLLDVLTELYYTVTEEMDANANDNLLTKTENILDMLNREKGVSCDGNLYEDDTIDYLECVYDNLRTKVEQADTSDDMRYLVYYYSMDEDVAVKTQAVFHDVDDALEFHKRHRSESATLIPMLYESEEYNIATKEFTPLL